ncbi:MAG: hypothetical protein LAT82_00440 [Nanoarchaeota archaeon]|nr:hypothetical protein [Nanoarchaeota archaeon]
MISLVDVFKFIFIAAIIISFTFILLIALSPAFSSKDIIAEYVYSDINNCTLQQEGTDCLISSFQDLESQIIRVYPNLIYTLIITGEDGIEYVSGEDNQHNDLLLNQRMSSCNLFRSCQIFYFSHGNLNYRIILM